MALGSGVAGLGTGLGTLFATLGRQRLQDANNALMKAKWDQQQAVSNSEIGKNDSTTALNRDQLSALQGIGDAVAGLGYTPQQSAAIGSYARANGGANLKNATDAALALQIPVAGTTAVPQLGDTFQRALGRDTTKVADGVQYNPLGDATQQAAVTPLGEAIIGARKAQAAASYGQANAANAHAGLFRTQTAAGGWNPRAGDGTAPGGVVPMADPNGAHGDAYLTSLDPSTSAQVRALSEGRMAFPTGTALKSPYWQGMLQHVAQYDPSFDAVNYNARAGTRKDFTSGKSAQTINKLNTVAEHLGLLSDDAADLNNTSFQWWNKVKNAAANATGDPSIARFQTARKAAADEVANVWRATGGSMADIEENMKNLDSAQSPEQLNAAIGTLTQLIHGKISALQDQYRTGMGTTADANRLVSPEAQNAFDKTLTRAGVDTHAFDQGASAQLGNAVGRGASTPPPQVARPTTAAQFAALPSGATYIDPDDGKTYRKP